ncbi:MAG: hypothetical protein WAM42_00445 [Candidatus Nitrosopolaris sp.]
MALKDSSSVGSASHEEHKLLREIVILPSIFVGLMILAIRPFGFRTFLQGLGHDNVFSLLLVASAVAVVLIMAQRIGLISPDAAEREENP